MAIGRQMAGKRVVVLGGGIGGLIAANRLRRLLNREHRITVVDRSPRHYFPPSFLWLAMGWRRPEDTSRELVRLLRRGVEFVQGEVTAIDVEARKVGVGEGELPFDYLVIALGAELAPQAVPGLAEASHSFYDVESARRLRAALPNFQGGSIAVVVSSLPFKCPAAPYEGTLLLNYQLRKRGIRDGTQIQMFTPEPAPLPVAGQRVGEMVQGLLAQREIAYHPQRQPASVDVEGREIIFKDGERASFDLLVAVPPHRSPEVVSASGVANEAGWVPVDPRTLETKAEGVYALGDVSAVTTPSGLPLPKAGVFAHGEAEVVAHNISAMIESGGKREEYLGHGSCFLETGYGKAAMATGNFYAEPKPAVKLRGPGRIWRWAKVLFEKRWLRGWV